VTSRPPAELKRSVVERANHCCEYCLIDQEVAGSKHQIDHVIAEKHGGKTTLDNLALSCTICNRRKGSDLSSVDPDTGGVVALFNPRTQRWREHFRLDGVHIVGLTPEGRATVTLLEFNSFERLMERTELIRAGRFPTARA
jgi:hypothetical protein